MGKIVHEISHGISHAVHEVGHAVGDVTDAIGLTDHKGEAADRKQAKEQADRSYGLTKTQLDFQKAQYDDWKSIYGPLQEDLGTYFKNLTGNNLTSQHLEAIQLESQKAQTNIDAALAQRGLSQSGLEAQALMQNQFSAASQKANIRANADQLANQQKMGFLGLGLGQGTQMLGINAQVSNNGASNSASMSNNALSNATALSQMNTGIVNDLAGSFMGSSNGKGGTIGGSLSSGFMSLFG